MYTNIFFSSSFDREGPKIANYKPQSGLGLRFSFFSFHFFSFSISFVKLIISLHGLQGVENHCPHLRDIELKTGRKIPFISAFPIYYSLNNWIGEHEITKLKEKK